MGISQSLRDNPRLDRWLRFEDDRTVRVATGKVELGQGILTALAQIAAEELDLGLDQVRVMSGNSVEGPGEGYTASSWSVEHSGAAIRAVCAEVRAMALDRAALRLNAAPEELAIRNGSFLRDGAATGLDYWHVAPELDLTAEATGTARPKPGERPPDRRHERAAPRPAGEARRRRLHPGHGAAGHAARAHAAPAGARGDAGFARRRRHPARGRRWRQDRPARELRRLRRPGRDGRPQGRGDRGRGTCDLAGRADAASRAGARRLDRGPAFARPPHRRSACPRRASTACLYASAGPTCRTGRSRHPAP